MPNPKAIKSPEDYETALAEIERLIDSDPPADSEEAERLEVISILVQDYEATRFPFPVADPIDAIEFRMEQQGLTPRDLVPYIGSRSKVSEVLSRKRPLTLSMIRALHEGLDLPAKVLIQETSSPVIAKTQVPDWSRFPIREMIERGWIESSIQGVASFFEKLNPQVRAAVLFRRSEHIRSGRSMDTNALAAWMTRIILRARDTALPRYTQGSVTLDFMKQLAKCSAHDHGPRAAQAFLKGIGVPLVIEPHLPYTYLDGAAILVVAEQPIIGMTVRYDRLDNFWFTLMHEVAHIALHFNDDTDFIDDLDVDAGSDPKEREADELAGEALIPTAAWKKSPASRLRSPEAAQHLAKQLGINPAIVAGRMRHEWKAFRLLNNLVGHHEVRREFAEIKWPT